MLKIIAGGVMSKEEEAEGLRIFLFVGLDSNDIKLLVDGHSMRIDIKEMTEGKGVPGPVDDIMIFTGVDHSDLINQMGEALGQNLIDDAVTSGRYREERNPEGKLYYGWSEDK